MKKMTVAQSIYCVVVRIQTLYVMLNHFMCDFLYKALPSITDAFKLVGAFNFVVYER